MAIAFLATLTLGVAAPNVKADRFDNDRFSRYEIAPVDLVSQAYRGQFKDIGIPSYSTLILYYRWRRITAEDLVETVVEAELLPESVIEDESYLTTVDAQLRSLESLGIFRDSR